MGYESWKCEKERERIMAKIINAIFEDGVFKPTQNVEVKEHEKVAIKIVSLDEWQARFNRIIEKIHQKAGQYHYGEIESDISEAMKNLSHYHF